MDIRAVNESARRSFGPDASILVARAIAWGNEDTLLLVNGTRHAEIAADLARAARADGSVATVTAEDAADYLAGGRRGFSLVQIQGAAA